MDHKADAPGILRDFLAYHETIKGHSGKTVDEYYLDLRNFFRFLKIQRGLVPRSTELGAIDISDVDLAFVAAVTLSEVYEYLAFLSRDRVRNARSRQKKYGVGAATRARKVACIRSFYRYLTVKAGLLRENPVQGLDSPKLPAALPRYLSLEESRKLLASVQGRYQERDYCILCIFLNCGLRISEIVDMDLNDVEGDHMRVPGKGDKERIAYFNDATADAVNDYLLWRKTFPNAGPALFLSNRRQRISRSTVHALVKKHLAEAGLDASRYSAHKLRHTAATLMMQNGVDVRTLQELLGHDNLNTTQIYTHVDNGELKTAVLANPLGQLLRKGKEKEKQQSKSES